MKIMSILALPEIAYELDLEGDKDLYVIVNLCWDMNINKKMIQWSWEYYGFCRQVIIGHNPLVYVNLKMVQKAEKI